MKKINKIFILYISIFICFESILTAELKRHKKDIGSVISIVADVGPPVYNIIKGALKKKGCSKKIDPCMVNNYYNANMKNSQNLKNAVSSRMAEAGNAIHLNEDGFFCDEDYCIEMGPNAKGSLGICSRQYCVCEDGDGSMKDCGPGKVYDPMYDMCTCAKSAILCH